MTPKYIEDHMADLSNEREREAKWDARFLQVAKLISTWSKDPSTKIGCVLVADRQIIATGYNGFSRNVADTKERWGDRPTKYSFVVHAEENALLQCARHGISAMGATLYCWCAVPCERCMASIINAGVSRIVCLKNEDAEMTKRWPRDISYAMVRESGIQLDEV
jgi:dCMP deaminase